MMRTTVRVGACARPSPLPLSFVLLGRERGREGGREEVFTNGIRSTVSVCISLTIAPVYSPHYGQHCHSLSPVSADLQHMTTRTMGVAARSALPAGHAAFVTSLSSQPYVDNFSSLLHSTTQPTPRLCLRGMQIGSTSYLYGGQCRGRYRSVLEHRLVTRLDWAWRACVHAYKRKSVNGQRLYPPRFVYLFFFGPH